MLSSRQITPSWHTLSFKPSQNQLRTVVSIAPPRIYEKKPIPRKYGPRKTYLYNQYTRLLASSSSSPLIFLQHTDFNIPRLIQLRKDIATAAKRHATPTPSLASPSPSPVVSEVELPTLTVIRTSIFGVVLREYAPLDVAQVSEISKLVEGGLAILSLPSLNPPQLNAIVRTLDRTIPPKKPPTPQELEEAERASKADPPQPGRKPVRVRPTLQPELKVLGALVEGRVLVSAGVRDVAKLPTLETLRAQIVGLVSSPGQQIAGVLGQAGGGRLARTLEGLKKSLEEGEVTTPS
ncbi:hypothetical protein JAAARDRAFT_29090 [Jaapia argillacea MUCL 33604]|uniref:Ribosomal protein L10 n=1 Tax=Jaapia argillacea MUCL 33604 TaxID=933084 RepID=A0A067Q801_9AGAM|nr:hypothetical protein JAAARDRAFT_29090 [Jaapia argillacea MUCL 33604]